MDGVVDGDVQCTHSGEHEHDAHDAHRGVGGVDGVVAHEQGEAHQADQQDQQLDDGHDNAPPSADVDMA